MRAGAAALLVAASCALVDRVVEPAPKPGPEEGAWAAARASHTREVKLYDGLATRAFATVTWEAPPVRAARVERVAAWQAMTEQERAALRAAEEADAAQFEDFTFALFTADRADNDLDATETSWRVALVRDDVEALPVRVEVLRPDALLRTLYPYVGDFDVVYRLRFRRQDGAAAPTLRVAGPRGRMEFAFAR